MLGGVEEGVDLLAGGEQRGPEVLEPAGTFAGDRTPR